MASDPEARDPRSETTQKLRSGIIYAVDRAEETLCNMLDEERRRTGASNEDVKTALHELGYHEWTDIWEEWADGD